MRAKPFVLMVLDGWGHRNDAPDNAITQAKTPVWNKLWQDCPHLLLSASGEDVGLPHGQMGNSEVGHMNLGAGRIVYQDLTRINKALAAGELAHNAALQDSFQKARNHRLHLLGLVSDGGVHSHYLHLVALANAAHAAGVTEILVHAFHDGRDT